MYPNSKLSHTHGMRWALKAANSARSPRAFTETWVKRGTGGAEPPRRGAALTATSSTHTSETRRPSRPAARSPGAKPRLLPRPAGLLGGWTCPQSLRSPRPRANQLCPGGPNPRPLARPHPPRRPGGPGMRGAREINRVIPPGKKHSRKFWSSGRGLRLPQPERPGAPTGSEARRGAPTRAEGPLGRPRVRARRRARGRAPREETEAAAEHWGPPPSKPAPRRGQGPGHRGRGAGPRLPKGLGLGLQGVPGASHLGSGARARSSVPCCRHRVGHRLRPLPAGGATGQQREPVSLL